MFEEAIPGSLAFWKMPFRRGGSFRSSGERGIQLGNRKNAFRCLSYIMILNGRSRVENDFASSGKRVTHRRDP